MIYLGISCLLALLAIFYLACKLAGCRQRTFRRLIDHVNNIGYYRHRVGDGAVLAPNRGFLKILELDADAKDVAGRPLSEFLVYVDGQESINERFRTERGLMNYEFRFRTLKGNDRCVLLTSHAAADHLGRGKIMDVIIEDITEERLSREKMIESREKYEKLFRDSGDMVILFGLDNLVIEEVNPVTEVVTGFAGEELIGRSFEALVHPLHRKRLRESHENLLFGESAKLEAVIVCKSGAYKDVIMTMSGVEMGSRTIAMAVIKDISAHAGEREEERRRNRELENFWRVSTEREERIKELREELKKARRQIELLKGKHGV